MVKTDPITVATTWHFLQRVCREMRDTTERTATNVLATALHLPDWVFIRPIFYKGELVFSTCMGIHVPGNGGAGIRNASGR